MYRTQVLRSEGTNYNRLSLKGKIWLSLEGLSEEEKGEISNYRFCITPQGLVDLDEFPVREKPVSPYSCVFTLSLGERVAKGRARTFVASSLPPAYHFEC